jgi:hypothetical protein
MKIFKMLMLGALALTSVTSVYCSSDEENKVSLIIKKDEVPLIDREYELEGLEGLEGLKGEMSARYYSRKDDRDIFEYAFLNSLERQGVSFVHPSLDIPLNPNATCTACVVIKIDDIGVIFFMDYSPSNQLIKAINKTVNSGEEMVLEIAKIAKGKDLNNYQNCAEIVSAITGKNKLEFAHHRATGMGISIDKFAAEKKNNGSWIVNKI